MSEWSPPNTPSKDHRIIQHIYDRLNELRGGVPTNPVSGAIIRYVYNGPPTKYVTKDELEGGKVTVPGYAVSGGLVASQLTANVQDFITDITFSATDTDTVAWTAGTINLKDGSTYSIAAGNTGNMTLPTYIYWYPQVPNVLTTSTDIEDDLSIEGILLCYAQKTADATQKAMYIPSVGVLGLNSANLQANSVTADQIAANSVTAGKISVAFLSAISANMGTLTSGTITLTGAGGYFRMGATPPTSATVGTGMWMDYTGFYGLNTNVQTFALSAVDGSLVLRSSIGTKYVTIGAVGGVGTANEIQFFDAGNLVARMGSSVYGGAAAGIEVTGTIDSYADTALQALAGRSYVPHGAVGVLAHYQGVLSVGENGYAVQADATSNSANDNSGTSYALWGQAHASGSGTNIAVYGYAASATTNWAGYFDAGNVYIKNQLWFPSGAVINFANGNSTITHSTGLLTFSTPVIISGYLAANAGIAVQGYTLFGGAGGELVYTGGTMYYQAYDHPNSVYLPVIFAGSTFQIQTGIAYPQTTALNIDVSRNATFAGNVTTPSIKITTGANAGYFLTCDADGDATWVAITASQVYKGTVDGDDGKYNGGATALIDGTGTAGWYYRCNDAGTYDYGNPNGNSITLAVGDDLYYNGAIWQRIAAATGITSLNTLIGTTQTFVDDTNVTIVSSGTTHTITWVGTLADSRLTTISTAGKVSGSAITSGTISGTTVFNAGTVTAAGTITGYDLKVGVNFAISGYAGEDLGTLQIDTLTAPKTWTLPDTTGTIALTNDARFTDARVASDVYAWAKAAVKPTYTYSEVGAAPAAGNSSIVTVGTITSGIWNAGNVTGSTLNATANLYCGLIHVVALAGENAGLIYSATLSAQRTWTFPNATGTIITTGNLTDIVAVGTITSGVWHGSSISTTYTDAKCTATWPNSYSANQSLNTNSNVSFLSVSATNNIVTNTGTVSGHNLWGYTLQLGDYQGDHEPTMILKQISGVKCTFSSAFATSDKTLAWPNCSGTILTTGNIGDYIATTVWASDLKASSTLRVGFEGNDGTIYINGVHGDTIYTALATLVSGVTKVINFPDLAGTIALLNGGQTWAATTLQTNLNADLLDGLHSTSFCRWRGRTHGAPSSPVAGDVYDDLDTGELYLYSASWRQIS